MHDSHRLFPKAMPMCVGLCLFAAWACVAAPFTGTVRGHAQTTPAHSVVAKIPVGPGGGPSAITVDTVNHRVYVPMTGGNSVAVLDSKTSKILGSIPFPSFVSGVAVNPSARRLYAVRSAERILAVVDVQTGKSVTDIPISDYFDRTAIDPSINRVFLLKTGENGRLTIINGETDKIAATLPLTGKPTDIAVNPKTHRVYVVAESGAVTVLDAASGTVVATRTVNYPCYSVGVNPTTGRVYLGLYGVAGLISVRDEATLDEVGSLPDCCYGAIKVDPEKNKVYVSNSVYLIVIDGGTNQVSTRIPAANDDVQFDIDPSANRVFIPSYRFSRLGVIDTVQNRFAESIILSPAPMLLGINSQTGRLYVYQANPKTLDVIDRETRKITASIPVTSTTDIAVNTKTNRIYLASQSDRKVLVIDGAENRITAEIPLTNPSGVAVDETNDRIFVFEGFRGFTIIDGKTNTVVGAIETSATNSPGKLAFNPTTNRLFAFTSNSIHIADLNTRTYVGQTVLPATFQAAAVHPTTNRLYVCTGVDVSVFDGSGARLEKKIPVSPDAILNGIAVNEKTNRIYTVNFRGLHVIDGATNTIVEKVSNFPGFRSLTVDMERGEVSGLAVLEEAVYVVGESADDPTSPTVSGVLLSKTKVKRKKDATVMISWSSSDNIGVAKHDLQFAADGRDFSTPIASALPGDMKAFTWTIPASVPKTKAGVVKVVASDVAGNRAEAMSPVLAVK